MSLKRIRLFQVCINYQKMGDKSINCIIDGKNIALLANKRGCKDICQVFDNGNTKFYPSRAGTLQAFKEFCLNTKPGDYLVFQYSGHGGSIPANGDQDEGDNRDEVFCFVSKDGLEVEELVDDQVAKILGKYLPKETICLFIIDACHSGTILDLSKKQILKDRDIICISSCRDNQQSLTDDNGGGGLMTQTIVEVLNSLETEKKRKVEPLTVDYVFNKMVQSLQDMKKNDSQIKQNFQLSFTEKIDPSKTPFPF